MDSKPLIRPYFLGGGYARGLGWRAINVGLKLFGKLQTYIGAFVSGRSTSTWETMHRYILYAYYYGQHLWVKLYKYGTNRIMIKYCYVMCRCKIITETHIITNIPHTCCFVFFSITTPSWQQAPLNHGMRLQPKATHHSPTIRGKNDLQNVEQKSRLKEVPLVSIPYHPCMAYLPTFTILDH